MRPSLPLRASSRFAFVVLLLLAPAACSKKSNPTSPGGGGGGGSDPFDSGLFASSSPVTLFVHTFNTAGTFGYHCSLHGSASGGMRGSVQVSAAGVDSPTVTISDNSYSPSPVLVKTGSYVKWVAAGGSHSVTTP